MSNKIWMKLAKMTGFIEAIKGGDNKFKGYKYVKLENILEALMPKIAEVGLGFNMKTPTIFVKIGDNEIPMMNFILVFVDLETGDCLEINQLSMPYGNIAVNTQMPTAQDIGGIQTYGRKYALKAFFNIADGEEEDVDKSLGKTNKSQSNPNKSTTKSQPQLSDKSKEETTMPSIISEAQKKYFIDKFQPLASQGIGVIDIHDKFLEVLNIQNEKKDLPKIETVPNFDEYVKLLTFEVPAKTTNKARF